MSTQDSFLLVVSHLDEEGHPERKESASLAGREGFSPPPVLLEKLHFLSETSVHRRLKWTTW